MVLINGNKYACETCIKGHRSSTCRHTDRPLFEIKKKGRPVTQCDHCRQLRKTKQVHVKCICEGKEDHSTPTLPPAIKKGHTKIPGSAMFPNGLPEALGASVAQQASSEAASSDSENGGCKCKQGGACNCCTPRKTAPRLRKGTTSASSTRSRGTAVTSSTDMLAHPGTRASRTPSHILARLSELRPVLPRPVRDAPSTDLWSGFDHGYYSRHHSHENLLYSPYGRAYDLAHHHEQVHSQFRNNSEPNISMQNTAPAPLFPAEEQTFREQLRALEVALNPSPMRSGATGKLSAFPSTCGCGPSCSCPGCFQHNGAGANTPSSSAFSSCANPGACNTCLDCTILSLPASLPPDRSLSIFEAYQAESIDDWIRQVSSLPPDSPTHAGGASRQQQQQQQQQQDVWDNYLSPITEPPPNIDGRYRLQECCGVLCKCSPEFCQCDLDNEDGYDCRRETMAPDSISMLTNSNNRTITTSPYDTSVEGYGGGCGVVGNGNYDTGLVRSQSGGGCSGSGSWGIRNYLAVPDIPTQPTRSRSSSSSSSHSSHQFDSVPIPNNSSINSTTADYSSAPSFPLFSLPDLGTSLQPRFSSPEMRGVMPASPPRSLYGGGSYPIGSLDMNRDPAEAEMEESMWNHQMLQHPWPRTNRLL